jgi:hypothetical protein
MLNILCLKYPKLKKGTPQYKACSEAFFGDVAVNFLE